VYQFNLRAILVYFPLLPRAIAVTLILTVIAVVASTIVAYPIAKARMSRFLPLVLLARGYVELFRNIPILVLLYVYYFGLAEIGLHLTPWWASLLALVTNAAAYCSEIIRSGYSTIGRGQREAGLSVGLHAWHIEAFIVLPQVARVIIPPFANHCIGVLLGSSIAAIIGATDLADWMMASGDNSFRYMESFFVAAIVYIVLCQIVSFGMSVLDRRMRLHLR
jgi:His/Glu/Gln/Arg/opine family amino acid ABC transporter permease subunit